jgi:hypothetical protein
MARLTGFFHRLKDILLHAARSGLVTPSKRARGSDIDLDREAPSTPCQPCPALPDPQSMTDRGTRQNVNAPAAMAITHLGHADAGVLQ